MCTAVNKYAPTTTVILKNNDKPWLTADFKSCVDDRNLAFSSGDIVRYKKLRNKVNRLRCELRAWFFKTRLNNLKKDNNRKWWSEIKGLCGFVNKERGDFSGVNIPGTVVSEQFIADYVNKLLIDVTHNVPALDNVAVVETGGTISQCPDAFVVTEFEVYNVLSRLNTHKASLYDIVDNGLLRALAACLSTPICALINASIQQSTVPDQWKMSRVTLIPKIIPIRNLEKDIRPISITCPVPKVAEWCIDRFFEEHFNEYLDPAQFGNTKGRSTLLALIKFMHTLFVSADDCRNIIRILFVDFRKAFELIDHTVLQDKLNYYNFPPHLSLWLLRFLSNRNQFVKVGSSCSTTLSTHAGAPQGTRAGPNVFKVLINDLKFSLAAIKYVDDVTVVSVSSDPSNSDLQNAAYTLSDWSNINGLNINTDKTNEMLIHFGNKRLTETATGLLINGSSIAKVETFKLLGIVVSADLSWKAHVAFIVSKACKRLFVLYQLLRLGISKSDVIAVYCSLIRSVLEYCCPVWHCGLTQSQSAEIEAVQRRALKLIFPDLSYREALFISGLEMLSLRREQLSIKVVNEIKVSSHVLHHLLLKREFNSNQMLTRDKYPFTLPAIKTNRATGSLIVFGVKNRW